MNQRPRSKWVATVTGRGMRKFHVESPARDALEGELGNMLDTIGRIRWTIAEQPASWACDGQDGCEPGRPVRALHGEKHDQMKLDL